MCLRLALEVQYLVDRFGIHQLTVSRTFNFLSHQFFHWFCQRLNSLSTFCFDHFVPRLHNRTLQLFFYLSWCCHTSFICTFCGELIIYILTFFQILCNFVLVKFISFTAWVLTYSRLVGDHFNQHTHTPRAKGPFFPHTVGSIFRLSLTHTHTHARACALTHSSVFKLTSERLLLFCADRWNIVKLYTTMQHVSANYTWEKENFTRITCRCGPKCNCSKLIT